MRSVIPDSEVVLQSCRSCGAVPKKPCVPTRTTGMHFARWEAAYEARHGEPPEISGWSAASEGVRTFNDATFGRSA